MWSDKANQSPLDLRQFLILVVSDVSSRRYLDTTFIIVQGFLITFFFCFNGILRFSFIQTFLPLLTCRDRTKVACLLAFVHSIVGSPFAFASGLPNPTKITSI